MRPRGCAPMEGSVLLRRPTFTLKLIRHFEWRGNQNKSEMGLRRSNEASPSFAMRTALNPSSHARWRRHFPRTRIAAGSNALILPCSLLKSSLFFALCFPVPCPGYPRRICLRFRALSPPGGMIALSFLVLFPVCRECDARRGLAGLRPPPINSPKLLI
jgi:hypothetical protein